MWISILNTIPTVSNLPGQGGGVTPPAGNFVELEPNLFLVELEASTDLVELE
tara:strand:- start:600 stop:755 length:156 start_codon:yes stop_codon:yes gene_type:complete